MDDLLPCLYNPCYYHIGIVSSFGINLTLSHLDEYESSDADSSGSHRSRFSVRRGRGYNEYHVTKTYSHADYDWLSMERRRPGSRDEERRHFVRFYNGSFLRSSDRHIVGHMPRTSDGKQPDIVLGENEHRMRMRAFSKLAFRQICNDYEKRNRRSVGHSNVASMTADGVAVSHKIPKGKSIPLAMFSDGTQKPPSDINQLLDCVEESVPTIEQSKCVLKLKDLVRENDFLGRRVVDVVCDETSPSSYRWKYVVQVLGESHYGQECLVEIVSNASLPASHRLRALSSTRDIVDPHPRLIDVLLNVSWTTSDHVTMRERRVAVSALGVIARVARTETANTIVTHLESRLRSQPVRGGHVHEHVATYARALGSAARNESFSTLTELVQHPSANVRSAALFGLRRYNWSDVEPIYVEVLKNATSTSQEHVVAVKAMIRRVDEVSDVAVETLAVLYSRSINERLHSESSLREFFSRRTDPISLDALKRGERLRSVREVKETLVKRSLGYVDPLKPLADKDFGIDKSYSVDIGASDMKSTLTAGLRNLVRIYLSIFDGQFDIDSHNEAKSRLHMFDDDVDLIDGEAIFVVGVAFKNDILSNLLNEVLDTAVKVVGEVRNAIAPLVEAVLHMLDYLEVVFSDIDRLIEPIQPIIDGFNQAVDMLDLAINASFVADSYIIAVNDYVLQLHNLNLADLIIGQLETVVDSFLTQKLENLTAMCNSVVVYVTEPIDQLNGYITNVTNIVQNITDVVDSFPNDPATQFGLQVCQVADQLLNFNASAILDGANVSAILTGLSNQLLGVVESAGLSTFYQALGLATNFTTFIDEGAIIVDGLRHGFAVGDAVAKELMTQFQTFVKLFESTLNSSKAVIDDLQAQLSGDSVVTQVTNIVQQLALYPIFSSGLVNAGLDDMQAIIDLVEKEVCDTVNSTLVTLESYVDAARNICYEAASDLADDVVGFLKNASQEIFGTFPFNGSRLDTVDVFQISQDLLEREVGLVTEFLNDEVLTHFDEYASAFVESVNETLTANFDVFVAWYEATYVDEAEAYLNGSEEFIEFVATTKNVTDLVAVTLRGVPGIDALKNVMDAVLDTTLNVAGWIQSVLEFLTQSDSFVNAGEKVRDKILNWILFSFAEFRSILQELLDKFSAALLQAGTVAMSYLSGGLQFVQDIIDSVLSLVDVIDNYVSNVLQNIQNVATNLKSTLLSSCAFSIRVDVVVTYGDMITTLQSSWNALVNATTNSASEKLISTTTAILAPISSLAEKISNFLNDLYKLTDVYTGDWASYVDANCVEGTLCLKRMFSDDLEKLILEAKSILDEIGLLDQFLSIFDDVNNYVEMLLGMIEQVEAKLQSLLDFALSTVTESVVALANSALDMLVPREDRNSFGATCSSLVNGFPFVASLDSVAQLGKSAWHGVSDTLLAAQSTSLLVADEFSENLVNLCNFFTALNATSYIMKPAAKIINSAVSLAWELEGLVEDPILSALRLASDVVLGFRFVVYDIQQFISDEIVKRIDDAIRWLETEPLKLLNTVRGWIDTLLLIDTGLAPGTLADPWELPYCSNDTCVQVMRRSTGTYRNVTFKVKYTHVTVLERDRTIIPGLFENYQVQGISPIDTEGSHYVLSMFGTEDKIDNPNLLVIQEKGSGDIKRIFRVLDANGTAVRGRFGVLVVQDWVYLHGVHSFTGNDGGSVGILYGIRKESLEPLTEVTTPKDVKMTLKEFSDSFGTGMFYAANESYLWITDFLDSEGNMLSGDPLPDHHTFDAESGQKGWIAGYATDLSGLIEASNKYQPDDLPVEVVKPSEILTIGENVAGAVSFVQFNIEFFAVLRCVAKPGFSCKLDFIEPPHTEDTSFSGIPVMYGVNLELDRSVRVPSGAVDVCFIENGESLVITHNSGAQAEQEKRTVTGGDLEDSTISLAVPVLRNSFDPNAVASNSLSLVVLGDPIVDEELIDFEDDNSRRRRKKRQNDDENASDCYTNSGEIYNVDKIFYKTCEFPELDPTCDSEWVVVAEYLGIVLSLEYGVSGRVIVDYEAELCPLSQTMTARLRPQGSLTLTGAVTVTIGIASASLRLDITLLDTMFVPALDVGVRGDVLKACADFKVINKPITVTMSVGFGIMGPIIHCPSWKIWECTFEWGTLFTVWQVLFSWSCPTQVLTILPEICFSTPDLTPPETSKATVAARQNDARSFTVDMVGFRDPESEWLHFTVTAKPTVGVGSLVEERDVGDSETATIGNMQWSHGSHVAVTVSCHNSAGLTSSITADPFLVDLTPPEAVKLRDGNETVDIDYDCSYNAIQATYDDLSEKESDVAIAKWAIGTTKGGEELQPYTDIKQTKNLSNSNLVLKHNTTYYVSFRTINSVSVEGITTTDGVLIDHTKPLVESSVTPAKDGSYDCVDDYDFQLAQESFKACWLGIYDEESGMDYFDWTVVDSSGHKQFDAVRVDRYFGYKDGLHLIAKETYVAFVVAFNRAGLSSQYASDGMIVDITNPVCSEIADLIPGSVNEDADFAASLTNFGAAWTCQDPESGIAVVQAAIGSYKGGTDVLPFDDVGFGPNGTTQVIFPSFPFFHAHRYFVTGRAVNKAALITTFWSDGILVDETPPSDGVIYLRDGDGGNNIHSPDIDFQTSNEEICARWTNAFVELESPIENYYVSVYSYNGTMVQEELDVMLKTTVCFSSLALQNGAIYRVAVRAQNAAGLSVTIETDGVLVDATSPRKGALYDGQNFGIDIDAWTERTSAFGNFKVCQSYETVDFWPPDEPFRPPKKPCGAFDFLDEETGISYVETSVIDENGLDMAPWQYAGPTFYSMGRVIDGKQGGFYRFVVRAYNFAGLRTETASNGTVIDTTYPVLEDLIEYDYDSPDRSDIDYLKKADVTLGVSWSSREDVTEIVARDWAIGSYSGGTDLLDFTSPINANSTYHGLSSLSLGHSYYATVRITNAAGLRTVLTTDGFLVDYQPPSKGYVQDGWDTYDVDYQTTDTTVWCLWRWIDDYESGVAELFVGVSEKETGSISSRNVSPLANRAMITNLDLLSGHTYVCNVKAIDFVGLSSVSSSNGFLVVTSPPICSGSVYDGESGEVDITSLSDVFVARWDPCSDERTTVEEYMLGIAIDSTGQTFAYPFQSFGSLLMGRYQNVALNQSSTYYAVVRAVNSAGLTTTFTSDGVQIDATPPMCSHVGDGPNGNSDVDFETTPRFAAVNWNCFEDVTRIVNASWIMGIYQYGDGVLAMSVDAYAFEASTDTILLSDGIKFYSSLVLFNELGLRSVYATDGFLVDTSPPTVDYVYDGLDVGLDAEYQGTLDDISANWQISDVQSGVSRYVVVISPPPVEGGSQTEVVGHSKVTMPVVLNQGGVYFISVTAFNNVGLSSNCSSNGITVDATEPDCAYVYDGPVIGSDVATQSVDEPFAVNWNCVDDVSGIKRMEWIIVNKHAQTKWKTILPNNANVSYAYDYVVAQDDVLQSNIVVQNGAGLYIFLTTDGVIVDSTPPKIFDFTVVYIPDERTFLLQWRPEDLETGVVESRYSVGLKQGSGDVVPLTSVGENVDASVQIDDVDVTVYYFNLFVMNGARATATETEISVSDRTAPVFVGDLKVTVLYPERQIPTTETTIDDASLLVSWKQIYDVESNVVALSWCLNLIESQEPCSFQPLPDDALSQNSAEVIGFTLEDRQQYTVTMQAMNGVGLTSYQQSNVFTAIFGEAAPGAVYDGAGYGDQNYQPHGDGIWARWEKVHFASGSSTNQYSWGVGTSPDDFSVQELTDVQTATQAHTIVQDLLLSGVTYYVTVLARDLNDAEVKSFSDGVTVDMTPPTFHSLQFGASRSLRYISNRDSFWISWNCSDEESFIARYELSIGTTAYLTDLLPKREVNASATRLKVEMESMAFTKEEETAFLTMTAHNKAGYSTTYVSHRVLFDFVKPNKGSVQVAWTANGQLEARWEDFWDEGGLSHYEWSIGTVPGTDDVLRATSVGLANSTMSRNSVIFVQGTLYYVSVTAYDKAGNGATGQAAPLMRDVTPPQGRSVAEGLRYYTDTGSIHVTWDPFIDNETNIVEYYLCVGSNVSLCDVLPSTYVGLALQYDVDSSLFTPGEKRYVAVTAVNSVGLLGHASSDEIVVDRSAPVAGQIEVAGGKFVSSLEPLVVRWSRFYDNESHIDYYEWSLCLEDIGECAVPLENVHNLTEVSKDGIDGLLDGRCYVARVVAHNKADLSTQSESECVVFDSTPPESKGKLLFVADDNDEEPSPKTNVSFKWEPILDRESFVTSLRLCVLRTQVEACDATIPITPTTSSEISLRLRLDRNESYYATLTATNGVGLASILTSSTLKFVSTARRGRGTVVDGSERLALSYQASTTSVSSNWFGFSGDVVEYRWGVGTTPYDADVLPFADVGRQTSAFAAGLDLAPGKVFYNLVKAVDRFGRTFFVASSGFTVDNTAPVINYVRLGRRGDVYGPYEAWTGSVAFFWSVDGDEESGIESTTWSFCANSTLYSCAATNIVVGNATSVTTTIAVAMGACYYAEIRVQNGAGLASTARSQCTVFDNSPPMGGVVIDGDGTQDRQYQSSKSRMSFHWSDFYDTESSVKYYVYCIGSSAFSHDVRACHDVSNATLTMTVGGLNLEHGRIYFATVYAVNRANLNQSVCSNGVVVDDTPPVAGAVFDGAKRPDIDYSNSSSTVSASWDQFDDDISSIRNCSWWAGSSKYDSDIVPRTDIELATQASSTGHSIPSGWRVFVSVACANSAGMTTTAHSNGYLVDTTPPTAGSARFTLFDHPAPDYLSDVATLVLSWVGFYENETSLSHYRFALVVTGKSGKSAGDFINAGLLSKVSLEGAGLVDGFPYKAKVRAYNLVGLYSQAATKTHIVVDRSKPETGRVADGTSVQGDVDFQSNSTLLSAHWTGFSDPQSGIQVYWACYGYVNSNQTLDCQSIESNLYVDFYGAHLLHGSKYTVTVYAVNRVNLTSVSSRSDGVLVDVTPPSPGEVYDGTDFADVDYQTSPTVFSVSWTNFVDDESGVEYYTWKANVNMSSYEMTYISERNVGLSMHAIASGQVLSQGTHVVSSVKAINRAGLVTEVQSDGVTVDMTRPLGGIVYDGRPDDKNDKDYLATQSLVSAHWADFFDPESGIAGYNYTIYEHTFNEVTSSWSLGVAVAKMVNLTKFQNFTMAVDGGMKPGYRYTVAVTAHNGAGLTVTVTSDGFRHVPNNLCFAVDSRRASRFHYHLSGAIELDEPARVLCPSNYSLSDSNILTPSTDFAFTVWRENSSLSNGTENNGTNMVEMLNSTEIGTFVSPLSPCCRQIGSLPVSYVSPHLSYKLLNFDAQSTSSKLISFRRMAIADARSVAFMKISDTSQKETFLSNSSSTDAPRMYVSGAETVAIVYDDRFLLVDASREVDVNVKGYVIVESVCQSVSSSAGTFCSVVTLANDWTNVAVSVHCGDSDFVVFGVVSPSGNGLELTWSFVQMLVSKLSTCDFEMSSDEFGNVLLRDTATLSVFNCHVNDQCSSIGEHQLGDILSAKLLPKTSEIVALHGSQSIAFYSLDFDLICETVQLESPLLNFMEVDQYSFSNDTQVLTIGTNHLYVTLFQTSFANVGGCQQIGGVELTSDYLPHAVSIKDEMIAFGSPDTDDNHLRMHLSAYCNPGSERSRKSVDSFVLECYPCVNKRSSGGGHDDCTRCFETQCFDLNQTTIDVTSPSLDLENGAKYTIKVDATNEGDKEATVSSQRIVVDFTPPVVGLVHNGDNQSDILYAGSTDYVLFVSWSSFYDTESDIMAYLWCVGSSPYECDMSPMEEVAANVTQVVCEACIGKFVDRVTYFSTVVAVNWALRNSSNSSLGLLIDLTPPVISFVREGDSGSVDLDFQMATTYLKANWAADDFESGIYEYDVVIVPGDYRAAAGNQTEWIFNNVTLKFGARYRVVLNVTNGAQLTSVASSDGVVISDKNAAVIDDHLPVSLYTNDINIDVQQPPFPPPDNTEPQDKAGLNRTTGVLQISAYSFSDGTDVEVYELTFRGSPLPPGVINPYKKPPPVRGVRYH